MNNEHEQQEIQTKFRRLVFSIEGNIGCGKSTLVELLRQKYENVEWIEQPVREWQNIGNDNLLKRYYSDSKRWGFTLQIFAIYTRIQNLLQADKKSPEKIKISERSILSDKYVFAQIMKQYAFMDQVQYQIYKSLYSQLQKLIQSHQFKIIYLRCSPQKCFQRTQSRKRQQEQEIPFQYLQRIHNKHQNWINNYNSTEVLILDTTQDFKQNQIKTNQLMEKTWQFVNKWSSK